MSAPIALVFDELTVTVVVKGHANPYRVPFTPDDPQQMIADVRRVASSPSAIVVVIGLAHLEIATPQLPPLGIHDRLSMLRRDADRYFPITEPVAVASVDALAFAVPRDPLVQWVDAIEELGPVHAIVTAPQLCPRFVTNGSVHIAAGTGETGAVVIGQGIVQSVRRIPDAPSAKSGTGASHDVRVVHAAQLGTEALACVAQPLTQQLLDQSLFARLHRARTRKLLTAGTVLCGALLVLLWSADRWRNQVLVATVARADSLALQVGPAEAALARLRQASAEMRLVQASIQRANAADAPLQVLANVTRVLPPDTFVQRISWDGTQWLVEGTTNNAPRLVPLLDADPGFRDVRVASPGQRFLDAGRQRESFAINFAVPRGGANGAP